MNKSSSSVLALDNAHHGNSDLTNPQHRAAFPQLKYPMAQYEHENRAEEDKCLDNIKQMLKNNSDIGAMIVEPISSHGN